MSLREHFTEDGRPKTGFRDEQVVAEAVENIREFEPDKNIDYYTCSFCGEYHIGTWKKK